MLYIILPVHNRADVTARFVASLQQQCFSEFVLVLVDDGCTDQTVSRVRSAIPRERLIVLRGEGNLWWAGALQLAWEHVGKMCQQDRDAVLIINDDVTFGPTFLSAGMAVLGEHPNAAIQAIGVDPTTGSIDRGAIADLDRLRFRAALPSEAPNCLSTRGLLMSAQTFVASGGMRPRCLPHYLSDYEFTLRLAGKGVPLKVDEGFRADVDLGLSGLDRPATGSLPTFWTQTFSNRAKFNPLHWSAFAILVCPARFVPRHLAAIWFNFLRALASAAFSFGNAEVPSSKDPS